MRILLFFLLITLCACTTPQLVADPVVEKAAPVSIPSVTPLTMNPVQWKVMNIEDLKKLTNDDTNKDVVLYTLDSVQYQNMVLNFVEIKRYLTEQKSVIVLLKTVVEGRADGVESSDKKTPASH